MSDFERTVRMLAHLLRPGHRLMRCIDNGMRRWYSDRIGRVYPCACGKRFYA
jgi:hypothetical protein